MEVHSFTVWNLQLGGEFSHSDHVVSLYQLLPGLLVSRLQTQTQHPPRLDASRKPKLVYFGKSVYWVSVWQLTCSTVDVVHNMPTWKRHHKSECQRANHRSDVHRQVSKAAGANHPHPLPWPHQPPSFRNVTGALSHSGSNAKSFCSLTNPYQPPLLAHCRCFHTYTELRIISWHSRKGLYVRTQISEWRCSRHSSGFLLRAPLGKASGECPNELMWEHSRRSPPTFQPRASVDNVSNTRQIQNPENNRNISAVSYMLKKLKKVSGDASVDVRPNCKTHQNLSHLWNTSIKPTFSELLLTFDDDLYLIFKCCYDVCYIIIVFICVLLFLIL